MTKKARAGRDFEKLIARIENVLAPIGAEIKSPDYISDLVTGYPREVDVSIRIDEGNNTKLVTVECRDHRNKGKKLAQNDPWIEQLITKREKIGAWRTIAVSSGGFSSSAITTAKHYGIELRQLDEITDDEIAQKWLSNLKVEVVVIESLVTGITIIDKDEQTLSKNTFSEEQLESFSKDLSNTKFIKKIDTGDILSASDLTYLVQTPTHMEEDGEPTHFSIVMECKDESWSIVTKDGEKMFSKIIANYEFAKRKIPAPINFVQQYASNEEMLLQIVHGETPSNDYRFKVEVTGKFGSIPKTESTKNI